MPPKEEPKFIAKPEKNSGVLAVKVKKEPKSVITSNLNQDNNISESEFEIIKKAENKSQLFTETTKESHDSLQVSNNEIRDNNSNSKKIKLNFLFKKLLLISCGVFVVVLVGYLYFNLQKAEIVIWPKTETQSFSAKIIANNSTSQIDIDNKKIPAEIFTVEKDLWQDFASTGSGQNSGKASGTIKIYNKLNPPSSFTLKSGTHFLSDSGKYFVTSEKVTIPAGTLKNGKITPGSIAVKVIAEDFGKDYNIEASKFSIPKLVGTNYYYSIYAESTNSMTGGFLSDVKKVTEQDLANAKKELSDKVLAEAEATLRQKISSDYVLFDNAILKKITETFSPVKVGAVVDNFSYQVKVKADALVFKRQDIEKFTKDNITSQSPGKSILEKSFKLDFIPESVDLNSGSMIIALDSSLKTYQPVVIDDLLELLTQKNKLEVKDIILSRLPNQVERLDVFLKPFWTQKVPNNKDKIKIELKFE